MTKTAIAMNDLAERKRHNEEMERQGRINTILSGISNLGSVVTKAFIPGGGLLSAAKSALSGDALTAFSKLYQMKQKGKLSPRDFKAYKAYVQQIKGGTN